MEYDALKSIIEQEVQSLGLNENYVPALIASAGAESNFNPTARQKLSSKKASKAARQFQQSQPQEEYLTSSTTGKGWGLFQFDGLTKNGFAEWSKKNGLDASDPRAQVRFALLDSTGNLDEEFNDGSYFGIGYAKDLKELMDSVESPEEAARVFRRDYVRPQVFDDKEQERTIDFLTPYTQPEKDYMILEKGTTDTQEPVYIKDEARNNNYTIVEEGDTLSSIARRSGFDSVEELLKQNPDIENPNLISPGQEIFTKERGILSGIGDTTQKIFGTRLGMNKGGDVPMKRQVSMFEEGGLLQEGGTVDPESGNEVPIGSTQEEVRDDIPAQLSEGEFVMPADVVRYHGLDKMMALRDEAKLGLQRMEDMGQMGNADEAIIPDGVPFNISDLVMEDEPMQFNQGGYAMQPGNPAMPATGQMPTGFVTPPQQQFISPYAIAETPTYAPVGEQPTFEQLMPTTSGTYTEIRTYVNDAGLIMNIPFVNGQPLYPIPAGYRLQTDVQEPTPEAALPAVAAPEVQQDGRDDGTRDVDERNEQLQQQMRDKKEAARKLGYTKEQSTLDALLTMNPILRTLSGNPERGTILANGNIADGEGGSFDPITGKQVGFLGTTNLGKDDFEVTQEMFEAGITPASLAGLRNIAGDESIRDVIEGLPKVKTTPETTDVATQMDAITRPDMLDTQPAAPLPVYDAEVRRVPFSEIGKDFRGGMERYDAPTVEVTAEPTEIATNNRFGKLTDYQKVGDDYFRVKEDGTLSSAPASGLTRANLINPDSPIVDRTEVGGEPTEDRIALPVSRTDAIRQRKIDSENRAADESLAKIAREEAERQAAAAEEARKEQERIEKQNRLADERLAKIAEEQRQKEIIAEQTRRQQSQTDTSEADKQSAKEGRGNIVTDSSGRPVTDSRGQAVTTTRGSERDRSTIERQADAMRREADRKESKPASKPATSAADYNRKDGGGGGGGGNNDGCFAKGTLITMQDGSKKPVEQIDIGDEVAVGGFVFAAGRFLIDNLYDYEGIKVSGTHMVNEEGVWTRVQDSKKAKFESDDDVVVYIFGSENRRIVINDTLFTDYFEVTEQEKLKEIGDSYFTTWKEHAILDSEDNVKIRNFNDDTTTTMAAE
jgi:LysM repeat protein